jgi:S-DNA-T family DNA segregation ATPase FtsK/SpoIIIE
MANKKKVKNEKSSSITSGFRSIRNFLENEIFKGIIGLILIFVAGFMIYAFISFFTTSAADQSIIEAPKD